jgi:hypothetical protein
MLHLGAPACLALEIPFCRLDQELAVLEQEFAAGLVGRQPGIDLVLL